MTTSKNIYRIYDFCVSLPHINYHRNRNIVLNALISEFVTLYIKNHMAAKVLKSKDFYKVSLCNNAAVSICPVHGNISTGCAHSNR